MRMKLHEKTKPYKILRQIFNFYLFGQPVSTFSSVIRATHMTA
jgi:hypothetical protein